MKRKIKAISKFLRRLTVFDWLVVFVILLGLIFLALFIFKEERWIKVEVRVAPGEWWWGSEKPPYWLTDMIKKGDEQYDSLGRKTAEILDIKSYEWGGERKIVYLTLNLRAEVDKRRKKLKFNHQPLEIGGPIDLELERVGVQGLVTFIEGVPDTRVWEEKIVEARVTHWSEIFPETLGMFPWRAEAIKIGDEMKDTQGRVVAEVLDKKVKPAEKIVVTEGGGVFIRQDPIKKDVILTIKLKTVKQEGVNYYLDNLKVKVGTTVLLALPEIDIWPEITKIIE